MTTNWQEDHKFDLKHSPNTIDLWRWSLNYEFHSPFTVFMDLIGYSEDEYGEPFTKMTDIREYLGYVELDYLADALKEYAANPHEVTETVRILTIEDMDDILDFVDKL